MNTIPKLSSNSLPWPTDWAVIFDAARPLIVEIGFGYGQYLEHLHHHHPQANIIGLEINNVCLVKAEKAIPRKGMGNVRVVHSTAETALHHLFTPGSVREFHINFPDPWFKDRHAGRRLMQRDTIDALVSRLEVGGKLYLATDIREYAAMSAELLAATPGLTNDFDTPWLHEIQGRTITKYEKKARQVGRPCHYFAYTRTATPAPNVPVIKEATMPHLVLQLPHTLDEIATQIDNDDFRESTHEIDATRVNFKNVYRGERSLLFDVFVHETTINQRTALMLVERDDKPKEYTLKLSPLGNPRPTEGMHYAVRVLGDKLLALHPESAVIHDKLR